MPDAPINYLLGYGENLISPIPYPSRPNKKREVYTLKESKERIIPQIEEASTSINELPANACPGDNAVGILTLHPSFLAKSYFPSTLLKEAGLEMVGSKPVYIKPTKSSKKTNTRQLPSTSLFVAGQRQKFAELADFIDSISESDKHLALGLRHIEQFKSPTARDVVRPLPKTKEEILLEIVLHNIDSIDVPAAFEAYAQSLGIKPKMDQLLRIKNLFFLPVKAPVALANDLSKFSMLRVARAMPELRPITAIRSTGSNFSIQLPPNEVVDESLHAAIFDGGVHDSSPLSYWVTSIEPTGAGQPNVEFLNHGTAVSSAMLFGPLTQGEVPAKPFAKIDHFRIIDSNDQPEDELFNILRRIEKILSSKVYKFVNLSLGPKIPIEDDEVHAWTVMIDELLSDGGTLATIAVGNDGDLDAASGLNRIQPPGDCVNALCVGASNNHTANWGRAFYSCVGPGRSPGLVKPDVVAFGGSNNTPFFAISSANVSAQGLIGTSFSAPLALRMALGVRAYFGDYLSPLALRAILIHNAETHRSARNSEVGWGRIPTEINDYVVCPPQTTRIVYQGEIRPGGYVRAKIPIPTEGLRGNATIKATFCYACETDPSHPSNYTRAGLDIIFRPHDEKRSREDAQSPKSAPFFQKKAYSTEAELRNDAHKWETVLCRKKKMRGSSLKNPVFDIHYNAREESQPTTNGTPLKYSLVVTVESPQTPDLYNSTVRSYPTQIRPLVPRIAIPIQVRNNGQ